jgi:hypothetical protein
VFRYYIQRETHPIKRLPDRRHRNPARGEPK